MSLTSTVSIGWPPRSPEWHQYALAVAAELCIMWKHLSVSHMNIIKMCKYMYTITYLQSARVTFYEMNVLILLTSKK